jgi:uncharacterized protein (TIGR03067 family)
LQETHHETSALLVDAGLYLRSAARPRGRQGGRQEDAGHLEAGSAELAGKPFPDEVLKTMKLVLADGKYTVTVGEQTDEGTVKLDPAKTPRAMDIEGTKGPNKGKMIPAIYELKDNTLRICYDLSGKERPKEFKTLADSKLFLVEYKRDKP